MADRVLFLGWGTPVRGREERGLEVFDEAIGLYGRMQQEGRLERFDVVLLGPNPELSGYVELHGSGAQLQAIRESEDFRRMLAEATLVVDDVRLIEGYTETGVAHEVEIYRESIATVEAAS